MKYIYETHCHTSESSRCGKSDAATYARYFKALGYSGFFVTDHFWGNTTLVEMDDSWTWRQKIDRFCLGYEKAKAEGDKIGINVMFGWEGGDRFTHLLTYGLDKYWLYETPEIVGLSLRDYCDRVRIDGGFIVQAHPFREYFTHEITLMPDDVDAVEVINGANANNFRGNAYAEMLDLPKTAGSDIHLVSTDRRLAGVISDTPIMTPSDYISSLRNRSLELFERPNEENKDIYSQLL